MSIICFVVLIACSGPPNDPLENLNARQRLIEGNRRYKEFHPVHPHQSKDRLITVSAAQKPFAVVVSCSDSRVPPEIIFDQGIGDLFVIRTAGNVIGGYELASIEYAIHELHTEIIVVLGHQGCGAIGAFLKYANESPPGHINEIVDFIKSQPIEQKILHADGDRSYQAVINNVIYCVNLIKSQSSIIKAKFDRHEVDLYGAVYMLDTGDVRIIEEEIKK